MRTPIFLILLLAISTAIGFDCKSKSQIPQETKDEELVKAVKNNNLKKVKELLEDGANPNAFYQIGEDTDYMYGTVLGEAVDEKHLEIARLLLEHGANVDKNFYTKDTLGLNFEKAITNQDIPMMKLLIDYKANLDIDNKSSPAIFRAKNKEVLDFLIDKGFDVNQQENGTGFTCVMRAIIENDVELVKAILGHQPNLNLKLKPVNKLYNFKELTALEIAKIWKREDETETLKQKEIIKLLKEAGAKR